MSPTEVEKNVEGWSELMKLVRNGRSWSGGERNRMFLNGGRSGGFHEMSYLAGLDQGDDGRGLAVVDWDQDGRLDLWYRNRTAPRLRLMMNGCDSKPGIAIKLEGVEANRDGVGAVVELLGVGGERLVRSVRAGDLFLSQSSKWLHFAGVDRVGEVEVLWPGGVRERFGGEMVSGGRFLLKQGLDEVVEWRAEVGREALVLVEEENIGVKDSGDARIVLPARIPMPVVEFRDQAARFGRVLGDGKPRLLLLWSGDCAHCKRTLMEIGKKGGVVRSAGLDVLALSVDGVAGPAADTSAAYDLIDVSGFPFMWGMIDGASAKRVHDLQAVLFDRTPASAVPLAILLDETVNAIAIYRGSFRIEQVLEDWKLLQSADERTLYHLAPPLRGTWFTNPLPRADLLRMMGSKD